MQTAPALDKRDKRDKRLEATETRHGVVADFLGLERNIVAVAVAIFLMAFGENLWKRFVPKYLEALGAPAVAIGLYGTTRDFLDGVSQYPGGWIADRFGRRRALTLCVSFAVIGYTLYWIATSWVVIFVGLAFVMAWSSMTSPTLFAVVGDALPQERRAIGFTVQSIVKRAPIAVAPAMGGLVIAMYGVRGGVRLSLLLTVVLALLTLVVVSRVQLPTLAEDTPVHLRHIWRAMPPPLRRLLLSDVFIRTCEGLVDVFIVLYATNVIGVTAPQYGMLVAVEMTTASLVYLPAAKVADWIGRKPFVIATFLCFSLFPVAVVLASGFVSLVGAFFIGGLREIGEPARKAMILDCTVPAVRGRTVGLYYLMRSLAIAPAASLGGLLWTLSPHTPFLVAGLIGMVGTLVFAATVGERYAG
jgi:MFS family permease